MGQQHWLHAMPPAAQQPAAGAPNVKAGRQTTRTTEAAAQAAEWRLRAAAAADVQRGMSAIPQLVRRGRWAQAAAAGPSALMALLLVPLRGRRGAPPLQAALGGQHGVHALPCRGRATVAKQRIAHRQHHPAVLLLSRLCRIGLILARRAEQGAAGTPCWGATLRGAVPLGLARRARLPRRLRPATVTAFELRRVALVWAGRLGGGALLVVPPPVPRQRQLLLLIPCSGHALPGAPCSLQAAASPGARGRRRRGCSRRAGAARGAASLLPLDAPLDLQGACRGGAGARSALLLIARGDPCLDWTSCVEVCHWSWWAAGKQTSRREGRQAEHGRSTPPPC